MTTEDREDKVVDNRTSVRTLRRCRRALSRKWRLMNVTASSHSAGRLMSGAGRGGGGGAGGG